MESSAQKDITRQIVVIVSALVAVFGGFYGSGAAGGTQIADAAGGALQEDSTTIAPGGPAFAIWSVIYLGLIAFAIWQALPAQRSDRRQRALGYPIAATMLLNAAWIASVQAGIIWLSVVIIAVLLAVLVWAFLVTLRLRPHSIIESIVVDGTIGLYLGWVTIATVANIAAALAASGFDGLGISADIWGSILAIAAGIVGIGYAVRGAGRLAPTAALCWALSWVAFARLTGDLISTPTAISAIVSASVLLIVTVAIRLRSARSSRFATAGSPLPSRNR
ncbi:tryptophan-rich sensory protein [Salinibacterium hongtaonis]|uniref:Tryptophan-rich sensory protein n=1 Tax=Homoserinimonas hongtaonis TaxID=2079791 RepID=A0A2U1T3M5_9MICO|nr:tryptophan-rich sensory protein [Salinibacterium hongtaonis]PWB98482.1 hypothetical protein DF220_06765 [Salinibacterium hongtaonis]